MSLSVIARVERLRKIKQKKRAAKNNKEEVPPDRPSLTERAQSWARPLLQPKRYKGAYGGRGGGKSHWFAEMLIEHLVENPDLKAVCIREFQKSLKFSAKMLIEEKIESLGVGDLFTITTTEIRRNGGRGIIIFQGMQDHTADSIKSLEGFNIAWVEEAQNLSARSLKLLRPTIRVQGSEIWFTWNPENESDPVDRFLRNNTPSDAIVVKVLYTDNIHLPETLKKEAESDRASDMDYYTHVWMGGYNKKSKEQVFADKWVIDVFEPTDAWDGPYHGVDFGFSADPSVMIKAWTYQNYLYIERESYAVGLELDDTFEKWTNDVPGCDRHVIRADSSWSQSIAYLKRHGLPNIVAVDKWKGSVEDGIKHIRKYEKIVVHERCVGFAEECEKYKHKVDKRSGDILPDIVDKFNHGPDGLRYAIAPIIKNERVDVEVHTTDDSRIIYSDGMEGY